MAVKIRMKRLGRKHRSYFRICATDSRAPRDGRVIEEIGSYDPSVALTDARCTLNNERIQYWLSVGAQPSDRVRVLIKKYGTGGTHLKQMEAAIAQLKGPKVIPDPGPPAVLPQPKKKEGEEAAPASEPAAEAATPGIEASAPEEKAAEEK
jgi:small subunit ribosomal protein S16